MSYEQLSRSFIDNEQEFGGGGSTSVYATELFCTLVEVVGWFAFVLVANPPVIWPPLLRRCIIITFLVVVLFMTNPILRRDDVVVVVVVDDDDFFIDASIPRLFPVEFDDPSP
jgi:hypothetical protein